MTPRSSCPGGESTPLQGANLRLNYEINNVTDTALGNLGAEDTIVLPVWPGPQLQTAWVTFGKQRRVNSGARRSMRNAITGLDAFFSARFRQESHSLGISSPYLACK